MGLKSESLADLAAWKPVACPPRLKQNRLGSPSKLHSQRTATMWPTWRAQEPPFCRLSRFDKAQNVLTTKIGVLVVGGNGSNCFTVKASEAEIMVRANQKLDTHTHTHKIKMYTWTELFLEIDHRQNWQYLGKKKWKSALFLPHSSHSLVSLQISKNCSFTRAELVEK